MTLLGCGGKQVAEPSEPEPPWAADYQRVAREGCACGDPACLDAAHARLAKMEADHGGLDDAPPSVQTAHGEFEQCWRGGTQDMARDLADASDAVCKCTDTKCVNTHRIELIHIGDRYKVNLDDPSTLDARARAAFDRGQKCLAAVTVPGDEYLDILARTTKQFCDCGALDCIRAVFRDRAKLFGERFVIGDLDAVRPQAERFKQQYCRCLSDAVNKGIEAKTIKPDVAAKIDVAFNCQ